MTAIAGEGTGMERDYDYSSVRCTPPIWKRRRRSAAPPASAPSARLNPRKVSTRKVPVVFDPRVANSLVGASGRRRQRRVDRAQDQLPARDRWAQQLFADGIRIIDDPHAPARPALAVRSTARALPAKQHGADRRRRADVLDPRLRHRARTRPDDHRPRSARRFVVAVAERLPTCIWKQARVTPAELIADIKDGFYVTDLIGRGVNMRDRRLQPRRLRLLDRERQAHLCGQRGHHRRASQRYLPAA